MKASKNRKPV